MRFRPTFRLIPAKQAIADEHTAEVRSRRLGIIGLLAMAVMLTVTGVAYVAPTGFTTYAAHMTASGGLKAGDEVRIAGIAVGKVSSVHLDHTQVEVKFAVDTPVPVGSESSIEVKLLTPLGGHYVALTPRGSIPLGHNVIPAERTSIPFEINDIIYAATPVLKKVDGTVIHDTFAEIAKAANKYPDALRNVIQTAAELTSTLGESTADFHRGMDFVNHSLSAMVSGRKQLVDLVNEFALIGNRLTSKRVDIVEFFTLLDELARLVDRVMTFYSRDLAPVVNGIDDIFDTLFTHPERIGVAAQGFGELMNTVGPMLSGNGITIDEHDRVIPGQDICLPHLFRQC